MEAIRQSEDGRRFNVRLLCIRASVVPMDEIEAICRPVQATCGKYPGRPQRNLGEFG
jgi:uncharacterized protein (DUF3084 family)